MVTILVSVFSNTAYTGTRLASVLVYCGMGMRHREWGRLLWKESVLQLGEVSYHSLSASNFVTC